LLNNLEAMLKKTLSQEVHGRQLLKKYLFNLVQQQ